MFQVTPSPIHQRRWLPLALAGGLSTIPVVVLFFAGSIGGTAGDIEVDREVTLVEPVPAGTAEAPIEVHVQGSRRGALTIHASTEDERGVVITIPGNVLFATDKSELLPSAARQLDEIAEALHAEPEPSASILGYTDSRGDPAHNLTLSRRRAQAVRAYLISRGVQASHLTAIGMGQSDPIADNATAEGRANNRRVEIVIAASKGATDGVARR